jgi:PAS domain S-box-containing protein
MSGPLDAYTALADLLDHAPSVLYCLKSADGRYLAVNRAFAERTNARSRVDVIGRRASELFPAELAARYETQDAELLASGQPLPDELELITGTDGERGWYTTTKHPVREGGEVVAIAVVSVDLQRGTADDDDLVGLRRAVAYAHAHLADNVTVDRLATEAAMTVTQLERRMHRAFGVSPKQYVIKARVEEAARLLVDTDRPLAEIAATCGWYDQSAFARQFTRIVGATPSAYRGARRRPTATTNDERST